MKIRQLIFGAGLLFLMLSCENDKQNFEAPQPADSIFYTDFMPDSIIESIRYFVINPDPLSCGNSPVPTDSSDTGSIDVDGDSISDFVFHVSQNLITGGGGGSIHCVHVVYSIVMSGIHSYDSISSFHTATQMIEQPVNYDTLQNSVINPAGSWSNSVTMSLRSQGVSSFPASVEFGETIIGIKVNNHCGWIQVTPSNLSGIIIKECALNLTDFNSIRAGQKQ